jgi:hypothetical protein
VPGVQGGVFHKFQKQILETKQRLFLMQKNAAPEGCPSKNE